MCFDNESLIKSNLFASYKCKNKNIFPEEAGNLKVITHPDLLHNHVSNGHILGDKKSLFKLL